MTSGLRAVVLIGRERLMTKIRVPRLLAWYRVVPFLCMMAFGIAALAYAAAPAPLLRLFYPLSHEDQIVDSSTPILLLR